MINFEMLLNYSTLYKIDKMHNNSKINENSQIPVVKQNELCKEIKICLIFCLVLLILCLLIFITAFVIIPLTFMCSIEFQRFAMFPSIKDSTADFEDAESYGLKGVRNLYINVEKSNDFHIGVWHLLPDLIAETVDTKILFDYDELLKYSKFNVILYFHGNSGNRISPLPIYKVLRQFFHVITFDYRGYGDSSTGKISEENVVNDCIQVYKWLRRKTDNNIYVWGHSLGAAIASHTVAKLNSLGITTTCGMFLEAPFNNMAEEVAQHPMGKLFSWLPWFKQTIVMPLIKNGFRFETDTTIMFVNCPVLILNAEDDDTVPPFLVKKLVVKAQSDRNLTYQGPIIYHEFLKIFGYGHHFMHKAPELPDMISNFINECETFSIV